MTNSYFGIFSITGDEQIGSFYFAKLYDNYGINDVPEISKNAMMSGEIGTFDGIPLIVSENIPKWWQIWIWFQYSIIRCHLRKLEIL